VSQALELTTIDSSLKSEFVDEIVNNKLTIKQIRSIKKTIAPKFEIDKLISHKNKSLNLVKKSNLALKITLSRIDDLIEDAHGIDPKQRVEMIKFLMCLRLKIHSMIDDTIKFKKNLS
ncbi:MAG: transcriptional regulator, partial [Nitrosopumilus sp.]|nr:transcriptional regulator [Nitrosopumilus sp.]